MTLLEARLMKQEAERAEREGRTSRRNDGEDVALFLGAILCGAFYVGYRYGPDIMSASMAFASTRWGIRVFVATVLASAAGLFWLRMKWRFGYAAGEIARTVATNTRMPHLVEANAIDADIISGP